LINEYNIKNKNMKYEKMIINKVMNSDVVYINGRAFKDRYYEPEINDSTILHNADSKYDIEYWDKYNRVLKLKTRK